MSQLSNFLRRSWQSLTRTLASHKLEAGAIGYYIAVSALDVWSSVHMPAGFVEENPWARDMFHRFVLERGIWIKVISLGALFGVALPFRVLGRVLDEKMAALAFSMPFIAFGAYTLVSAVFPNFLNALGWYQP